MTYVGVSALSLLGRLPRKDSKSEDLGMMNSEFLERLTQWLISRQTSVLYEDEESSMVQDESFNQVMTNESKGFVVKGSHPSRQQSGANLDNVALHVPQDDRPCVGVNGRCNKVADTCYTFWAGGSLAVSVALPQNFVIEKALIWRHLDTQQSTSSKL